MEIIDGPFYIPPHPFPELFGHLFMCINVLVFLRFEVFKKKIVKKKLLYLRKPHPPNSSIGNVNKGK